MSTLRLNYKITFAYIIFLVFFVACPALAATLSAPEDALTIIKIPEASEAETFYGQLEGFPHTYEFSVSDNLTFSAQVQTHPSIANGTDLSLILVKKVKRGVEEVARINGRETKWQPNYNLSLGLDIKANEILETVLSEGEYILEVSTPNNDKPYRLLINGGDRLSLKELFISRSIFKLNKLGVILSLYICIPISLLLLLFFIWRRYKS